MANRMYRYRIHINDQPQTLELTGDPLHVEADRLGAGPRAQHVVDFWADHSDDLPTAKRTFQVFGTGHQLPDNAYWWGTTARTPEGSVWHLYELTAYGPDCVKCGKARYLAEADEWVAAFDAPQDCDHQTNEDMAHG